MNTSTVLGASATAYRCMYALRSILGDDDEADAVAARLFVIVAPAPPPAPPLALALVAAASALLSMSVLVELMLFPVCGFAAFFLLCGSLFFELFDNMLSKDHIIFTASSPTTVFCGILSHKHKPNHHVTTHHINTISIGFC